MTDLHLETRIREAFDSRHVPNPGLEERVIAAAPWQPRNGARSSSTPRLAGAFTVVLAVVVVVVLVAPTVLSRLDAIFPGLIGAGEPPAYSLAAVTGDYVFIVQRSQGNVLLQSSDNGVSWVPRLRFDGIYGGAQILGDNGFVWSLDMSARCASSSSCMPPSQAMTLYRTNDGGVTWTALPPTVFPVEDVFFLDASHGWADSVAPQPGLNSEGLYATNDGGATWSRVGPLPATSPMGYVYGAGDQRVTFSRSSNGSLRGWYVGATQLFTSTDGGSSWHPVAFDVPVAVAGWVATPQQPAFEDPAGLVAIGYHDPKGADNATANRVFLYASGDGGATWGNPYPAPEGFAPVGDILSTAVLDPQHVWLTSQSLTAGDSVQAGPAVARTTTGGRTWQVAKNTPRILQMMFLDPYRGYALDVSGSTNVNGILKTTDGGATWQRLMVPIFPAKA